MTLQNMFIGLGYGDVPKNFKSCHQCQIMKIIWPNSQGEQILLEKPTGRCINVTMDLADNLSPAVFGNNVITVIVDQFIKRNHFIAEKKEDGGK